MKRERSVSAMPSQSRPERSGSDGADGMDEKPTDAQDALQTPLEAQERAPPAPCLKQGATKGNSGWCPCPLEAGAKRATATKKDTPQRGKERTA